MAKLSEGRKDMIKIPEQMWAEDIKKAMEMNEIRAKIIEEMMSNGCVEKLCVNVDMNYMPTDFITKVKFQYSERTEKITTIVWFADGDKRTATPADGDIFNKRTGIEQCILKKIFGNGSRLKKIYREWT